MPGIAPGVLIDDLKIVIDRLWEIPALGLSPWLTSFWPGQKLQPDSCPAAGPGGLAGPQPLVGKWARLCPLSKPTLHPCLLIVHLSSLWPTGKGSEDVAWLRGCGVKAFQFSLKIVSAVKEGGAQGKKAYGSLFQRQLESSLLLETAS